jgi:tetratricopeptide (TPR) repeat protein
MDKNIMDRNIAFQESSSPTPSSAAAAVSTSPSAVGVTDEPYAERPAALPLDEPAQPSQFDVGRQVKLGPGATDRETLLQGMRAFERGQDDLALQSFLRLSSRGVRYADVHYMTGLLLERRGDIDAALTSLQEAIRINPSYVEALLALASLHEHRGEYEHAQVYAERASQLARGAAGGLDPTTRGKLANQQAQLADAFAGAGERREAIEEYRRALARCPTYHDIRHRLGITLREAGLPAQAAEEFQRILRAHPGLLESQIQLGLTYYSIGRTPEAIREWSAVLEKDPSRDTARMYLQLVRGSRQNSAARFPLSSSPEASVGLEPSGVPAFASMSSKSASPALAGTERNTPGWAKTALSRREPEADTPDPSE